METLEYSSTVDKTSPLYAQIEFPDGAGPHPLLVVMHGYSGSSADVVEDVQTLAAQGVVALAPDMRGGGNSAGRFDSGGLDVHDILDAVLAALRQYPSRIDARNLNIAGYSGGGGNAIACAVRFPDLFQTCVSFFGISDYAHFHRSRWRPDCNVLMEEALAGTPDQQPDVYAARDATPAAANTLPSRLHFFWDEEEKHCQPSMIEDFLAACRRAGHAHVQAHVSKRTDAVRWHHGYRKGTPSLNYADKLFLPDVVAPKASAPRLPPKGELVVCGYLVTRHFAVWIEDGQRGQVTIQYDLTGARPALKLVSNPRQFTVRMLDSSPLAVLPA